MKITISCVGKIKEHYFKAAIEEYSKRLGRYGKLAILEVADEKTPDGASEVVEEMIKAKEGERLIKTFREDAYIIALAIEGEMLDSVALAERMQKLAVQGNSHIQFVIGGSLGLHNSVLERADVRLSFSKMTFPHQLMRVILLEQVYRGFRIINGEPYHK